MSNETDIRDFVDSLDEVARELHNTFIDLIDRISVLPDLDSGGERLRWTDVDEEASNIRHDLLDEYESWYVASDDLLAEYLPERRETFQGYYETVSACFGLQREPESLGKETILDTGLEALNAQRRMVVSIKAKIAARKQRAKRQVSMEMSKNELQRAREMLDKGLTRASGVIAGVALERHLLTMCEESEDDIDYAKTDGINQLAQRLYESDIIPKTTFKSIDTLGSIRNECAHADGAEPNEHKVRRLIEDTEDYIRGRGI